MDSSLQKFNTPYHLISFIFLGGLQTVLLVAVHLNAGVAPARRRDGFTGEIFKRVELFVPE